MRLVLDPPRRVAGTRVRVVSALRVEARRVAFGTVGQGEKMPVGLLLGRGEEAVFVGLDGVRRDPRALGLLAD